VRLVLQANGRQLGIQVLAAVVTAAWSFCFGFASMWVLKQFGLLKVSKETELGGIDLFKHNGTAYPEFEQVCLHMFPDALLSAFLCSKWFAEGRGPGPSSLAPIFGSR
jgi:hypothetical protein